MMRGFKIRRALAADPVPWALLLSADAQRHEVRKYLERGELWLAELRGTVVGEMVLLETRADVWEVMNIAVSAKYRRKGVGFALLKRARTVARRRGAHRLEVGTDSGGFGRLAFYQRFGFRIVAVDLDFFVRRYHRAVRSNGILVRDMLRMTIEFPQRKAATRHN